MPARHGRFAAVREYLRPWYLRNVYFRAFPARRPPYFIDCWRFPHAPRERFAAILDPSPPSAGDFLILPMTDWHARLQRSQFLAQALAALGHRCFLLNPHLGREFPDSSKTSPQLARLDHNIYELHVRLPREPVYHHRNLSEQESRILAQAVADLGRAAQVMRWIQVVSFPVWMRLALLVRESCPGLVLYDCHDRLSGFSAVAPEIAALEPAMIAASDLTICSAESLWEHCLELGASADRCHIVRNAVTAIPAHATISPASDPPSIGYLGALEDWFDVEAIRTAAAARPEWRFELAGRIESRRVESLADLPNVRFIGEIGRERVDDFLARLDVATIPFVLNPLTLAADPIKLYEYLAAGLPVVSADLPETRRFAAHIRYYNSAADFLQALEAALSDRDEPARARRRLAVAGETWAARGRQILALIGGDGAPVVENSESANPAAGR